MNILDFYSLLLSSATSTHKLLILLTITQLEHNILIRNFLPVLVLIIFLNCLMSYIGKPKGILPADISNALKTWSASVTSVPVQPFWGHVPCGTTVSHSHSKLVTLAFQLQPTFWPTKHEPVTIARSAGDAQLAAMPQAPSLPWAIPQPWRVSGSRHATANRDLFLQGRDVSGATEALQPPLAMFNEPRRKRGEYLCSFLQGTCVWHRLW